jgi:plastocyanin
MKFSAVQKLTFAVVAVALTGLIAACGGSNSPTNPAPGTFKGTIEVHSDFYTPASVTIAAGDSVTWVWTGSSHSVTEGTPGGGVHAFDSGVKSSGKFGRRFNTAGTVHYFCTLHGAAMTGKITVSP